MKWNGCSHHSKAISSLVIFVVILHCFLLDNHVACFKYLHSKRQQRQKPQPPLPQLTLDVEPHPGIEPTPHADPVPKYYFPVESGVLNFTCTIKHPSFRYKMSIVKTSTFNEDEKGVDLIDENHDLPATLHDRDRFRVIFDEITDEQAARYLRVTLLISKLKLSDNGIYKCKYSTITKQVNTTVFKPLHAKDISFAPATHPGQKASEVKHHYEVDAPTSFSCRVAEAYPKPTIVFKHSDSHVDLAPFTSEKELNHPAEAETHKKGDDAYYLHSIVSTLNYTIKYTDHKQNLSCQVHNLLNYTSTKTIHLDVRGVKAIEHLCKDTQEVKVGATDFNISCVYFSNPRRDAVWEHKSIVPKVAEAPAEEGAAPVDAGTEEVVNRVSLGQPEDAITSYVEELEPAGSGLYKSVITIKSVQPTDLKAYTFKLDDDSLTKEIRLVQEDESKNQHQLNPNGATTAKINFHSTSALVKVILLVGFLTLSLQLLNF